MPIGEVALQMLCCDDYGEEVRKKWNPPCTGANPVFLNHRGGAMNDEERGARG